MIFVIGSAKRNALLEACQRAWGFVFPAILNGVLRWVCPSRKEPVLTFEVVWPTVTHGGRLGRRRRVLEITLKNLEWTILNLLLRLEVSPRITTEYMILEEMCGNGAMISSIVPMIAAHCAVHRGSTDTKTA